MEPKLTRLLASGLMVALVGCAAQPPVPAADMAATPESPPTPSSNLAAATAAATVAASPAPDPTGAAPEAVSATFAAASTRFAFDMLWRVASEEAGGNVFLSPANAAIALAMAANGAEGETLREMIATLSTAGDSRDQLNADFAALQALLQRGDQKIELSLANSLWANAGVPFSEDYLARVQQHFDAEVAELDFSQPGAKDIINDWVAQHTNGKIDQIVGELNPDTILLLASAIYFLGTWQQPFDKDQTEEAPFTREDGSQTPVPLMFQSGSFSHLDGDGFQAIRLPYNGGGMRMVVVLPDEGRRLADLAPALTGPAWQASSAEFVTRTGALYLPRFSVEYGVSLRAALEGMGMQQAFDADQADFSAMRPIPPNIFISSVEHKTFVDVNEQGTEAAAATTIEMGVTSAQPSEDPFLMRVDRPFFVAIEETTTGIPIFLGLIMEPQ